MVMPGTESGRFVRWKSYTRENGKRAWYVPDVKLNSSKDGTPTPLLAHQAAADISVTGWMDGCAPCNCTTSRSLECGGRW